MVAKRVIQPRISPQVYFAFRELCHANGVTVERAVEELMRDAVERHGLTIHDSKQELDTK